MNIQNKNDWLQALRAVAALAVVFFHMQPHWDLVPQLKLFGPWTHWGFAGVDIFFVLSGYVVYQSATRKAFNLRGFVARRGLRIYLGYWPVLLLLAVVTLALHKPWPEASVLWRSVFLLIPRVFENWLHTAWSLTFELYFYSWIALLCLARPAWHARLLVGGMVLLLCWHWGWYLHDIHRVRQGIQPLYFVLTGFGLEFLAGALVANLQRAPGLPPLRPALQMLGGLVLVVLGFSIGSSSQWFDRVEILRACSFGFCGLGFLLVALALGRMQLRAPTLLVRIGDASFSLYLLHPILLDLLGSVRFRFLGDRPLVLALFSLALPVIITAFALAWYRRVEDPLYQWATRRIPG